MASRLASRVLSAAALSLALALSPPAAAQGGGHSGGHATGSTGHASARSGSQGSPSTHRSRSHSSHGSSATHASRAYVGVTRDGHVRIARDSHAKEAFRRTHPCPATGKTYGACPGWVVDHVRALKHGGADDSSNMQWQTRAAAKAKDRWE